MRVEHKTQAVKAGKRRQVDRRERFGGPVPDGYLLEREHDEHGKVKARHYRRDPDRALIIERMFALSLEGIGDPTIARRLNSEGHRTCNGRPWDRRAVQSALTNPFYAGRIAYYRGTADERMSGLSAPGTHSAPEL